MGKTQIKILGVIIFVLLICIPCAILSNKLGLIYFYHYINPMFHYIIIFLGIVFLIFGTPVMLLSLYSLKKMSGAKRIRVLQIHGIYRYVRYPFLSGLGFVLAGLGLICNFAPLLFCGFLALPYCLIFSVFEGIILTKKYAEQYRDYRKATPLLIPDFKNLIKDIILK